MHQRQFFSGTVSALITVSLIASLGLSGCAMLNTWRVGRLRTVHFAGDRPLLTADAEGEVIKAATYIEAGRNEEAVEVLQRFHLRHPTSAFAQTAHYYLGQAYENLLYWERALQEFRGVAANTSSSESLQAMALYHVAFCHEALGDVAKTIASLHDVLLRAKVLPREVAEAEVPARLAAAYVRVGQNDSAKKYYAQAEKGIEDLKQQAGPEVRPRWLAKTLYYMGIMSVDRVQADNFAAALRPMQQAQLYLLQAADVQDEYWSERASARLSKIYQDFYQAIEGAPLRTEGDIMLARQERQTTQWRLAQDLSATLTDLKLYRLPEVGKENRYTVEIFLALNKIEERITLLLAERPAGEGLTPEAQQHQGLKREGRPQDPLLQKSINNDEKNQ